MFGVGFFVIRIYCNGKFVLGFRYLDRYEKVHFLGEDGQQADDDDEDSRHRKWSARALHSVPLTYNHHQHNVAGNSESSLYSPQMNLLCHLERQDHTLVSYSTLPDF